MKKNLGQHRMAAVYQHAMLQKGSFNGPTPETLCTDKDCENQIALRLHCE